VFLADGRTLLLVLRTQEDRDDVYTQLVRRCPKVCIAVVAVVLCEGVTGGRGAVFCRRLMSLVSLTTCWLLEIPHGTLLAMLRLPRVMSLCQLQQLLG
jgi:hypothetical protein